MGFLDRMVADLIGDSTGLPVKGLVRKVGAKNLLMLGGMAAAGGYAAHKISQRRGEAAPPTPGPQQGYQAPQPSVPPPPPAAQAYAQQAHGSPPAGAHGHPVATPPPPPAPGHQAPPPPPPVTAAEPNLEPGLPSGLVLVVVRTMVAAALADGRMAPQERSAIQARLADSGLGQAEQAQVHQDLVIPAQPEELAAMVTSDEHRHAMFRAAVLVLQADQQISDLERAWLSRLGSALGLEPGQQAELEKDLLSAAGQLVTGA